MLSFLKARAAPAPSAADGAQRHIVLTAPGRSGSTLLQSFFLADCEAVTFFEPCRFTPEVGGEESLVRERCSCDQRLATHRITRERGGSQWWANTASTRRLSWQWTP